eukprot:scaffold4157_cov136-Cylindrotheca_fusiformis.AAC.32
MPLLLPCSPIVSAAAASAEGLMWLSHSQPATILAREEKKRYENDDDDAVDFVRLNGFLSADQATFCTTYVI